MSASKIEIDLSRKLCETIPEELFLTEFFYSKLCHVFNSCPAPSQICGC